MQDRQRHRHPSPRQPHREHRNRTNKVARRRAPAARAQFLSIGQQHHRGAWSEYSPADYIFQCVYCCSTIWPSAYSKRFSLDRKDRPSRFSDSASSGSTMASTSRTMRPPTSSISMRVRAAFTMPLAVETFAVYWPGVGYRPKRAAEDSFNATTEAPVSTMKVMRWPSM